MLAGQAGLVLWEVRRVSRNGANGLEAYLSRSLAASSSQKIVAPEHGVEVGIIAVDPRMVMALTSDSNGHMFSAEARRWAHTRRRGPPAR